MDGGGEAGACYRGVGRRRHVKARDAKARDGEARHVKRHVRASMLHVKRHVRRHGRASMVHVRAGMLHARQGMLHVRRHVRRAMLRHVYVEASHLQPSHCCVAHTQRV